MHVCNLEIRIDEKKLPITAVLNGEDELGLLLTGSKKSWIYQLLFFIFS